MLAVMTLPWEARATTEFQLIADELDLATIKSIQYAGSGLGLAVFGDEASMWSEFYRCMGE